MKEEAPSRSSSGLANRDPEGPPARPDTPNWDDRTSYEALLETALDAIVCMDEQGRLVEFNPAAEKLFGYTRKEAIGRVMADLIVPPSLREAHRNGLARYLATGEERVLNRLLELPAMRADGTEFPVELAITCQRRGERLLFTSYLRDISDRKRFEQELIGRQEGLRLALDAADMGTWEWEISTNRVTWSENIKPRSIPKTGRKCWPPSRPPSARVRNSISNTACLERAAPSFGLTVKAPSFEMKPAMPFG
jgi:PAS domain S-box-containing protein